MLYKDTTDKANTISGEAIEEEISKRHRVSQLTVEDVR